MALFGVQLYMRGFYINPNHIYVLFVFFGGDFSRSCALKAANLQQCMGIPDDDDNDNGRKFMSLHSSSTHS